MKLLGVSEGSFSKCFLQTSVVLQTLPSEVQTLPSEAESQTLPSEAESQVGWAVASSKLPILAATRQHEPLSETC